MRAIKDKLSMIKAVLSARKVKRCNRAGYQFTWREGIVVKGHEAESGRKVISFSGSRYLQDIHIVDKGSQSYVLVRLTNGKTQQLFYTNKDKRNDT